MNTLKDSTTTRTLLLFSLIATKIILQYSLVSDGYTLHRDEFLHLDQANHLDWGYLSVPPLTSWLSYLIQSLGNQVFWVKFFPALFGALTILFVWKAIEELGGKLFALLLGAICILFSVLLRLNTLYQPNSMDVLCWTASYFFLLKYSKNKQPKWLYYLAISFALGFLNKYNILFLLLGLLPAILLSPMRRVFSSASFYGAVLLAFLLILPNLVWQHIHQYPVFMHLRELSETQLQNVSPRQFLASQLLFFPGTLLIVLLGLYALFSQAALRPYRSFGYAFFFTLALFLLFKAKDYYAIGIHPIYFAFGVVALERICERKQLRSLKVIALLLPIIFFVPMFLFAFPNRSPAYIDQHRDTYRRLGMLRWEDGQEHALPQDFADMMGWKELAKIVDSAYSNSPEPQSTLVLCDNYGQAGAINHYSQLGIRAVSFEADYVNWFDLTRPYKHLIRIKQYREREEERLKTCPLFKESYIFGQLSDVHAREYGTTVFS